MKCKVSFNLSPDKLVKNVVERHFLLAESVVKWQFLQVKTVDLII